MVVCIFLRILFLKYNKNYVDFMKFCMHVMRTIDLVKIGNPYHLFYHSKMFSWLIILYCNSDFTFKWPSYHINILTPYDTVHNGAFLTEYKFILCTCHIYIKPKYITNETIINKNSLTDDFETYFRSSPLIFYPLEMAVQF